MEPRPDQFEMGSGDDSAGPEARRRLSAWLVGSPRAVITLVVIVGLGLLLGGMLMWRRDAQRVTVGQVMSETRAARVGFDLVDRTATESDRQLARSRAPRVYVADEQVFADLRTSLKNLPRAVSEAKTLAEVMPALREQFQLNDESLAALRELARNEGAVEAYSAGGDAFEASLRERPIVDPETFQVQQLAASQFVELRAGRGESEGLTVPAGALSSFRTQAAARSVRGASAEAELPASLRDVMVARFSHLDKPTYRYDEAGTLARQDEMASMTPERRVRFAPGQVMYLRGDTLTSEKLAWLQEERAAFNASLRPWQRGLLDLASLSLGLLAAVAFAAVVGTFSPGLLVRPRRLIPIAGLMVVMTAGALGAAWADPLLALPAGALVSIMTAMLIAVAEDRRTALGLGAVTAMVCAAGVRLPLESAWVILAGVGVMAWRLREVRHRSSLVASALWSAVTSAGACLLLGVLTRPIIEPAMQQLVIEAALIFGGVTLVGFVTLGMLPAVERVFAVTTGLTLVELRDPSHPLLRQLQQRAPGTYNHSINVAVLAEAAAEAIGAGGLLAYVGALYHDIGKMNKPEYFVENQAGGVNRHDRLTPAMSLLIIVGHVRDGIELAQAHGLPPALHHFIEAHHGTTLVEYFFHRARRAAENAGAARAMPQEVEYRYPGPRPRTKEVAIVMICDAAESAVRTLPEPSTAKIDSVVRAIAQKRLMDGQFEECDLTLRELNLIIEAVSRTLASFHHQRISYPDGPRTGALPVRTAPAGPTPARVG